MIDAAVGQIAAQLNQALRREFQVGEDLVAVSNLVEPDGTAAQSAANRISVFLVNIERDTVAINSGRGATAPHFQAEAPVHLNLLLMFAASFAAAKSTEALKFIAATVAFFQGRRVFDSQNTPDLDPRIERLVLDIENLNITDLSNLWGILGGRYVPSILYRVRMVTIDSQQFAGRLPQITRPETGVGG